MVYMEESIPGAFSGYDEEEVNPFNPLVTCVLDDRGGSFCESYSEFDATNK